MLLRIRNFAGFWILLVAAGGLVAVSWYAPASAQAAVAYLVTWILLLSAPKPVLELIGSRRRGRVAHSDADQLADLTRVPAQLWAVLFLVVNCLGLMLGVALLLPTVVDLVVGLLPRTG
jgi:hypothetical protein